MAETTASLKLTHEGALAALNAGIAKATDMGQPQCISVVDAGGHLLAFVRMDGAFHMSLETSLRQGENRRVLRSALRRSAGRRRHQTRPRHGRPADQPAGRVADRRRWPLHRRGRRRLGDRRAGPRGCDRLYCGDTRLPNLLITEAPRTDSKRRWRSTRDFQARRGDRPAALTVTHRTAQRNRPGIVGIGPGGLQKWLKYKKIYGFTTAKTESRGILRAVGSPEKSGAQYGDGFPPERSFSTGKLK